MCGKYGVIFEFGIGFCVDGLCKGESLMLIVFVVFDGDICVIGVILVEDDELVCDEEV